MSISERIEAAAAVVGNHEIARIDITPEARAARRLDPATLDRAEALFRENGYLVIEGLFTPDQMQRFDAAYRRVGAGRLQATNKADRRPLFTVPVEGPFASADLLDNPLLAPLVSRLLGEDHLIAAVSAVASFPGAPDQFLHRDASPLFPSPDRPQDDENAVEWQLPPFSITMLVPLIDFTHETGCTRVWPGSHRIAGTEAGLRMGSLDPEIRVGSVLLTDGRVLHRGAANRSDRLRPLFYLTFHRAWFRDFGGYVRRPPVDVPRRVARRLPAHLKQRLGWIGFPYSVPTMVRYRLAQWLPARLRMRLLKDT